MTDKNKLKDRARDELFSHINRCGVLKAGEDEQKHWMDETMEYLGERYPDLGDADLKELYQVGMRFCSPAIPHGRPGTGGADQAEEDSAGATSESEGEDSSSEGSLQVDSSAPDVTEETPVSAPEHAEPVSA